MADFYPMPPDVRKRIELEKLAPRRLSPTASAALAAKLKATEKLRRGNEECTACRRDDERMEDVGQDI